MKGLITTIILIITASTIIGQTKDNTIYLGNIISDTSTFKSNDYRTGLPSILESNYKIEIRFITSPSFDYTNYTILTFDKSWSSKYYYYTPESSALFSKDIISKTSIDTIFSWLVLNNIFSLPDQDSLKTEKYEYNPETNEFIGSGITVCDGTCYYVEFKVGPLCRRYSYCNPDSYADFYPHVYELRNFANIVDIFTEWTEE